MTLDPTLIDTVNANLPNLNVPDLDALRQAALPIFLAWARAVKLPDASGTLQVIDPAANHVHISVLLKTDANGNITVDDRPCARLGISAACEHQGFARARGFVLAGVGAFRDARPRRMIRVGPPPRRVRGPAAEYPQAGEVALLSLMVVNMRILA